MRRTRALALIAPVAAAAWWTQRHATSPAVAAWSPPAGTRQRAGPLSVRTLGSGDETIVLLHGLMSSGDVFGAPFDDLARRRRVVAPDLLGFGRSLGSGTAFGLGDQLAALDAMAEELDVTDTLWAVAGHSLGGVLALHWAARHATRVQRVVTWGAPLHTTREAGLAAIAEMSWLERLFAIDTPLTRGACAWSCRHRALAGWLAAATNPFMPVPLARHGSLHTWAAYRGALEEVILAPDWQPALETLAAHRVHVTLARGAHDLVSDLEPVEPFARTSECIDTVTHPDSGHELPLVYPAWCVAQLSG